MDPLAASSPNIYRSNAIINVIKIKGINTINHDISPKPFSHSAFNKKVIHIITIIFKNAVLYNPFNVSMIT